MDSDDYYEIPSLPKDDAWVGSSQKLLYSMTMPPEFDIDKKIEETREQGKYLRIALEHLGVSQGFSIKNLVHHGAICADVEFGREAYALIPYEPSVLIVGEMPAVTVSREKAIASALNRFTNPVIVKRLDAMSLVQTLNTDGRIPPVGLITWLRMYPEDASAYGIEQFIHASKDLLIPKGRIIVSFTEGDDSQLDMFSFVMQKGVDGVTFSVIEPEYGAAGKLILLAEKI
jgi:hypothetical protein